MGLYPMYKVNQSTGIDRAISQLNIELGNKGNRTIVKNVYAWFRNKNTSYPSMRLFLVAGGNANVKGAEMLYVGLACTELVQFLELRGVAVEVNVLFETSIEQDTVVAIVRAKSFEMPVDANQLLLLSSDPRYFRYQGFQALIALSNHFDISIPDGLGRTLKDIGKDFVTALQADGDVFEQSYALDDAAQEVVRILEAFNNKQSNAATT